MVVNYWRIAELERAIWGCTYFNPDSPVPMSDGSRTLHDLGLQLNVDTRAADRVQADAWRDEET